MDRATLHNIFSEAYNHENWLRILQTTFGATQLYAFPKPIILPNNERLIGAFELGNITTSDDRIIGLYRVDVKPDVWLERNKVSLRELLCSIYKYDVDGAVVVFVQEHKWRLSFISELKVLNDKGEIVEQATEPKRFTYLLGENEKVRTPSDRLSKLINKALTIQDILAAFSVEALNEEFYKIVQSFFYELVGGTIGNGKKENKYAGILDLPNTSKEENQIYKEFAVRLIGRTVFCWFLKMKKSHNGVALLPENLLSSLAVENNSNYYHSVLERLFFQTLNTPMDQRANNLPQGVQTIPFLNGGLFEPGIKDFYKTNSQTGLNLHGSSLNISDNWFSNFFIELEKYNFTIDENSVSEIEVSVDPEMLGRIFENLLAEIDPDSGESARKATGSFYTPREIVDYMATESLVQYLHNKTNIESQTLRPIFKMLEINNPVFSEQEKEQLLEALDQVKILDPACGSGAFPMGVLQKIVQALQKLDPEAEWWKQRQIDRIKNPAVKKLLKEKLANSGVEYARKIGIIQNSLFGVDIQPLAAEISKLRCFLSLVVDENIDENKPNRGIEPLPNLEFKFVTADTLIELPKDNYQRSMFDNFEELQELEELRNDYIQSYGNNKKDIKNKFLKVQQKITKNQNGLFANEDSKAFKIGNWDPFGNYELDWFDSKWMFGIEKFDLVIGNPPYVLLQNTRMSIERQISLRKIYQTAQYKTDLYHLFIEQGLKCLKKDDGVLCFITPNTYLKNKHNNLLRKFILSNSHVLEVIRFYIPIFKNASVDNAIIIANRKDEIKNETILIKDIIDNKYTSLFNEPKIKILQRSIMIGEYCFNFDLIGNVILKKIEEFQSLKVVARAYFGIQTFDRKTFVSKEKLSLSYKPVVDGGNIIRYFLKPCLEYVLVSNEAIKSGGNTHVYLKERILVRQIGKFPQGCYCPPDIFTLNTVYNIFVHDEKKIALKFLLSLINSSVIRYYWIKTSSDNKETFPKIKKNPLESIPIPNTCIKDQKLFICVVNYLLFLNLIIFEKKENINLYVSNLYLVNLFEEVLDAMVMELYFKEDFSNAGIEFIKYIERDFFNVEDKIELEQIEIICNAYQKLRQKNNEIRCNLKLMDIKLSHIVMPIKACKLNA